MAYFDPHKSNEIIVDESPVGLGEIFLQDGESVFAVLTESDNRFHRLAAATSDRRSSCVTVCEADTDHKYKEADLNCRFGWRRLSNCARNKYNDVKRIIGLLHEFTFNTGFNISVRQDLRRMTYFRPTNDIKGRLLLGIVVLAPFVLTDNGCKPRSCADLQCFGYTRRDGPTHSIFNDIADNGRIVHCDFSTDGGNWTVLLRRRIRDTISFGNNWNGYVAGFGTSSSYWLGLSRTHQLTSSGQSELRIELVTTDGTSAHVVYYGFSISGSQQRYAMHYTQLVREKSTTGGAICDLCGFQTPDNDQTAHLCSYTLKTAGWYPAADVCQNVQSLLFGRLNGHGLHMFWATLAEHGSLVSADMKLRPIRAQGTCVNPCKNNGRCDNIPGTTTSRCRCLRGYEGARCEFRSGMSRPGHSSSTQPTASYRECVCSNGGTCIQNICRCIKGFGGANCLEILEEPVSRANITTGLFLGAVSFTVILFFGIYIIRPRLKKLSEAQEKREATMYRLEAAHRIHYHGVLAELMAETVKELDAGTAPTAKRKKHKDATLGNVMWKNTYWFAENSQQKHMNKKKHNKKKKKNTSVGHRLERSATSGEQHKHEEDMDVDVNTIKKIRVGPLEETKHSGPVEKKQSGPV
ncbi:hypothetical protein LSAT2_025378 [Lamellibrachia satsuma]|nr:hypothetical protein LSAT2_025378 [Lamellibrachia satsuma]